MIDVTLNRIIEKETVMVLDTQRMEDTVKVMIEKAYELGKIKDTENFTKAILEREEIVSTGIGFGIAIPHAKLSDIEDFFVIVGLAKKGLDWDAMDRKPVRAVFLIGGPEGRQKEDLKIISRIMLLVKNNEKRDKLFSDLSFDEIKNIFKNF